MATFGQYDLAGLAALHPQTVSALYQQAHRIERRRLRMTAYGVLHGTHPTHLDDLAGDY